MRKEARFLKVFGKTIFVLAMVALTNPQVAVAACVWRVTGLPGSTAPRSVAALAANDVWMLAWHSTGNSLYHWDGVNWSGPPLPEPPPNTTVSYLSISGTSDRDIWLVGQATAGGIAFPISEHFSGLRWDRVPVPYDKQTACAPETWTGAILSIRAFTTSNAWGFEDRCKANQYSFMAIHWDGIRWTNVSAVNDCCFGLSGDTDSFVSESSDRDFWVVGSELFIHFDGHHWSNGTPRYLHGNINSVYVESPTDAWAVGNRSKGFPPPPNRTSTWHWDGAKWSNIQSPNHDGPLGKYDNRLDAVSGTGPTDVWAVGGFTKSNNTSRGMALHWDGQKWSFASPKDFFPQETLTVDALAPNVVWAFGYGPYAASYCH